MVVSEDLTELVTIFGTGERGSDVKILQTAAAGGGEPCELKDL